MKRDAHPKAYSLFYSIDWSPKKGFTITLRNSILAKLSQKHKKCTITG